MSKYLTFTTLIEPEYSVYLPHKKHECLAIHQDVSGHVWSEWPNSGPQNNAYVRSQANALEAARGEMARREFLEANP